jgi:hypothetical protein
VVKLCECRIGHAVTVAVEGIAGYQATRRLEVRSTPVLIEG